MTRPTLEGMNRKKYGNPFFDKNSMTDPEFFKLASHRAKRKIKFTVFP